MGGLVAMGFDGSGTYLLTVSHAGREVFCTRTWERVARDPALAYPQDGIAIGIGPIAGTRIAVTEKNYDTDELRITSADGRLLLEYDSGMIAVSGEGVED